MWWRILGAIAFALALGCPPATAAHRLRCRDGKVVVVAQRGGNACRLHGGLARVLRPARPAPPPTRQGRVLECRDGTISNRIRDRCRRHRGIKRWL